MKIKSDFARRVISEGVVTTAKGMYHAERLIYGEDHIGHFDDDYFVILFCSIDAVLIRGSIPWRAIGLFDSSGSRI